LVDATEASQRRVLIVDDDRLIGATLREMIADFGTFELGAPIAADVATSAREATRHLDRHAAGEVRYDLVVCDLSMPGTDGLALYEALAARGSPLAARFVLVTGGAYTAAASAALARHALPCLQKPFDADSLAAILRPYF
jgi:CheY-like chemotaxis protein